MLLKKRWDFQGNASFTAENRPAPGGVKADITPIRRWLAKPPEVPLLSAGEPRSPLPGVPDREMQATAGARPDTSPWKLTHISES